MTVDEIREVVGASLMNAELHLATAEAAIGAHFADADPEPGTADAATVPGAVLEDYWRADARRELLARLDAWLSGAAEAV